MTNPRDELFTAGLASDGEERLAWVRSRMALLARTHKDFAETKPFARHTIGMSLHLEPKTGILLETLAAGGAKVVATGNQMAGAAGPLRQARG